MNGEVIATRYETAPDGRVIIDIAIDSLNDLYNAFDKKAGFRRRELDQDFVEYLIESVQELEEHPFLIRISCGQPAEGGLDERVRDSIANYFIYLREVERRALAKNRKKTISLFFLGTVLLGGSVFFPLENLFVSRGLFTKILQEGIGIAAWVSLWEFFANLIFEWQPYRQKIKLYEKISKAEVQAG
ncbi:hypothetical protein ACUUL3_14465 [Thiovibrio sp. JS02]